MTMTTTQRAGCIRLSSRRTVLCFVLGMVALDIFLKIDMMISETLGPTFRSSIASDYDYDYKYNELHRNKVAAKRNTPTSISSSSPLPLSNKSDPVGKFQGDSSDELSLGSVLAPSSTFQDTATALESNRTIRESAQTEMTTTTTSMMIPPTPPPPTTTTTTTRNNNDQHNPIESVYQIPESDDFWWHNETSRGIHPNVSASSHLLRIFVYDNLPDELSSNIEKLLYTEIYVGNHTKPDSELVWVRLFRSYPGRTYNPSEADLFVVPYLSYAHCRYATQGWKPNCGHVPTETTSELLISHLHHYRGNERRHLFLVANDPALVHDDIMKQPLVLSFGPRSLAYSQPGHLVASIFNDMPRYQPSVLLDKSSDEHWTRHRKYSFVELSGKKNHRMGGALGGRKFRKRFANDISSAYGKHKERVLGGKPFITNNDNTGAFGMDELPLYDLYSDSVFCPVLSGDAPWQRRFFDVIQSGCLPLVLRWETPGLPGNRSWFRPAVYGAAFTETFSAYQSIPFPKTMFDGDMAIEIDYESFVLECPVNMRQPRDFSLIRKTVEEYLVNRTDDIRQKQLNMRQYALAFSIGLGQDAHRYDDGFARLIRQIKHYLDKYTGTSN